MPRGNSSDELREALGDLLPWVDTYEDWMGSEDFAKRDQAMARARAAIDRYDREQDEADAAL